jgi:endogenous inhibitor of DNA gyrase (YacG/DUF329 family)
MRLGGSALRAYGQRMGQHEPRGEIEMTSPVEEIEVECPRCQTRYRDWTRGSINRNLDDVDHDYVRRASTATCPECGFVVDLGTLVVDGDVWRWSRASVPE